MEEHIQPLASDGLRDPPFQLWKGDADGLWLRSLDETGLLAQRELAQESPFQRRLGRLEKEISLLSGILLVLLFLQTVLLGLFVVAR
jgi:hypothetical protein